MPFAADFACTPSFSANPPASAPSGCCFKSASTLRPWCCPITSPQADLKGGVALLIGNEGAGETCDALAQDDEPVVIPLSEKVESLNARVKASLILYEAARQRNQH